MKRLIVSVLLALGLLAAGGATAGASATNPGPGMGCTSGTDNCGGWVASIHDPTCVAYNVNWTHDWYGTPGAAAYWHVVVDQWWNGGASCTAGGGAHKIGQAGDFYTPDYGTPHINVTSGQGYLLFQGHAVASTTGTIDWTGCTGYPNPVTDGYQIYVGSTSPSPGQPSATWTSGFYSANNAGYGSGGGICTIGFYGSSSHNGDYIAWLNHSVGGYWQEELGFW